MYIMAYQLSLHVPYASKTCPKSRVLLRRFAASITRIHCGRAQITVEDHGLLIFMSFSFLEKKTFIVYDK